MAYAPYKPSQDDFIHGMSERDQWTYAVKWFKDAVDIQKAELRSRTHDREVSLGWLDGYKLGLNMARRNRFFAWFGIIHSTTSTDGDPRHTLFNLLTKLEKVTFNRRKFLVYRGARGRGAWQAASAALMESHYNQ
jgi:hypothetical protein